MSSFTQTLNTDANSKLTTSVYDTNVNQWMQKVQNYVQNSSGIWIPDQLDASGNRKISVKDDSGNSLFSGANPGNVQTSSSMRNPVTGVKTVTSTAAEIFAGASRLASRRKMIIKNESTTTRFLVGSSSVTVDNGFPIEPGSIMEFDFDPNVSVSLYAISEVGNISVAVMEA